jgi:hypothetical protein
LNFPIPDIHQIFRTAAQGAIGHNHQMGLNTFFTGFNKAPSHAIGLVVGMGREY